MKLSGSQNSEMLNVNPTVELVLKESIEKKYIDIHDEGSSLVERLMSYGIGPRVSRKLVDNFDDAVIKSNVEYSLEQAKVKNMAGYIRKAIENNYASSKQISQKSKESREKIFTNKLMELGVGRICSGMIIKSLEEHKIFSLQEENWLKESKIDIMSLREAYLNDNLAQIQIIPFQNSNVTNGENSFEADGMSQKDEAILLRSELGMAIACKEKINPEKYLRAQELGLLTALQGLAALCEVELIDLVKK